MRHLTSRDMQGAYWALKIRDPAADPEEIAQALDWINRSEDNELCFERALRFLELCEGSDPDAVIGDFRHDAPEWYNGTKWLRALAASIVLVIFSSLAMHLTGTLDRIGTKQVSQTYVSDIGQLQHFTLPDSSNMTLSGASEVAVTYSSSERRLYLLRGQAFFEVSKDYSRPFVVEAGTGATTAVGTAFDVRRNAKHVTVTVAEGTVLLETRSHTGEFKGRLGSGAQASYSDDGVVGPIRQVDVSSALSWRQGVLIFSNSRLSEALEDLNRFAKPPILAEGSVGQIRVTGVVKINRIEEWLVALSTLENVSLIKTGDAFILKKKVAEMPYKRAAR